MSNVKKVLLLLFVIVIIALIVVGFKIYYDISKLADALESTEKTEIITFANGNKIYVEAKAWGITGNHEQIIFSETPISIADKQIHYIFYTSEVFYKMGNDNTVVIYATESSISEPINKTPHIIVRGLKSADEIRNYNANYKNYGLERISIYE